MALSRYLLDENCFEILGTMTALTNLLIIDNRPDFAAGEKNHLPKKLVDGLREKNPGVHIELTSVLECDVEAWRLSLLACRSLFEIQPKEENPEGD